GAGWHLPGYHPPRLAWILSAARGSHNTLGGGTAMPYWVHGSRQDTDPLGLKPEHLQATDPLFIEAQDEQEDIAKATEGGMVVREVEYVAPRPEQASRPAPASAAGGAYEFTQEQNEVIGGLAWYMRVFGGVLVLFAILQLVAWLAANRQGSPAPLVQ